MNRPGCDWIVRLPSARHVDAEPREAFLLHFACGQVDSESGDRFLAPILIMTDEAVQHPGDECVSRTYRTELGALGQPLLLQTAKMLPKVCGAMEGSNVLFYG